MFMVLIFKRKNLHILNEEVCKYIFLFLFKMNEFELVGDFI